MTDERLAYIRAHPQWHDHELLEAYDALVLAHEALSNQTLDLINSMLEEEAK